MVPFLTKIVLILLLTLFPLFSLKGNGNSQLFPVSDSETKKGKPVSVEKYVVDVP